MKMVEEQLRTKSTAEIYQGYDECNYNEFHGSQKWVLIEDIEEQDEKIEEALDKAYKALDNEICANEFLNIENLDLLQQLNKLYYILAECPFKENPIDEDKLEYKVIVKPVIDWVKRLYYILGTCGVESCDDYIFSEKCRIEIRAGNCPRLKTEKELDAIGKT